MLRLVFIVQRLLSARRLPFGGHLLNLAEHALYVRSLRFVGRLLSEARFSLSVLQPLPFVARLPSIFSL